MDAKDLKKKYLQFFARKDHKIIESAPLIPDNDPTVLFTTAGMHPLVPFLLGEKHPLGSRVTNVQKCIRTGDIDEVGDDSHLTFFEMLGNWSFGDYFKDEAIEMSFEFLTKELNLDPSLLAVSVFAGDEDAPFDKEAHDRWRSLGIPESRIARLPKKNNWWGPAGQTGPCGPDTEIFYWLGNPDEVPESFNDDNPLWVEIWNNVFMQYNKTKEGFFEPLKAPNVDTGMGVERVAMILQKKSNVYEISSIKPIYDLIKNMVVSKNFSEVSESSIRIITDHLRASVFILGDERGVTPSNIDQGYVLRKLIRRSIRHLFLLKIENVASAISKIAEKVIDLFAEEYPDLLNKKSFIIDELVKETDKFTRTISKGLRLIEKRIQSEAIRLSGKKPKSQMEVFQIVHDFEISEQKHVLDIDVKWLFDLFQSQGMPPEMTLEELESHNILIPDKDLVMKRFNDLFKEHQSLSRKGAEKRFKGGLSDSGIETTRLHTATHLLNEALRRVISPDIHQKGSNITPERLRFDFNFDRKLSPDEIKKVEDLVNKQIKAALPVTKEKMLVKDALAQGAQGEFGVKYPDEVWVYSIGDFSKEICMGPHVDNTKELGHFKIKKEQSSAAGVRRIKAVLE